MEMMKNTIKKKGRESRGRVTKTIVDRVLEILSTQVGMVRGGEWNYLPFKPLGVVF